MTDLCDSGIGWNWNLEPLIILFIFREESPNLIQIVVPLDKLRTRDWLFWIIDLKRERDWISSKLLTKCGSFRGKGSPYPMIVINGDRSTYPKMTYTLVCYFFMYVLNLRGSSTFAPEFRAYFWRWIAKKLHMILTQSFLNLISTLLKLKKKYLFFFRFFGLDASLNRSLPARHSRLCDTISQLQNLETWKKSYFWTFY